MGTEMLDDQARCIHGVYRVLDVKFTDYFVIIQVYQLSEIHIYV